MVVAHRYEALFTQAQLQDPEAKDPEAKDPSKDSGYIPEAILGSLGAFWLLKAFKGLRPRYRGPFRGSLATALEGWHEVLPQLATHKPWVGKHSVITSL